MMSPRQRPGCRRWKKYCPRSNPMAKRIGTTYLLHFNIEPGTVIPPTREDAHLPFHARHYLGFTEDPETRIEQHFQGEGARLTEVLKEKGIAFTVARMWEDTTREFERRLKDQGGLSRHCPICKTLGVIPASRYRTRALAAEEAEWFKEASLEVLAANYDEVFKSLLAVDPAY